MLSVVVAMLLLQVSSSFPDEVDVTDGLGCLLHYMDTHRREVDLDAVFGLRMAEGQIRQLISNDSLIKNLPVATAHRLRDMADQIENIATDVISQLMKLNSVYFKQFSYVISSPWINSAYPRKLQLTENDKFAIQSDKDEGENLYDNFDEEQSDLCMSGLIGSSDENSEKCFISDKCRAFMINDKSKGYYLTHQLLFYSLGKRLGCGSLMQNMLAVRGLDIKEMERKLCVQVYGQMKMFQLTGDSGNEDLFMEGGAVCAPLGFYQVVRLDWITSALKWQDGCGCYKANPTVEQKIQDQMTIRRILGDTTLSDGCSSHTSGVAAGFLAASLYWLLVLPHGQLEGAADANSLPLDTVIALKTKLKMCVREIQIKNKYRGLHNVLTQVDVLVGGKCISLLLLLIVLVGGCVVVYYFRRRLLTRGSIWMGCRLW